jgi:hypothetical protein
MVARRGSRGQAAVELVALLPALLVLGLLAWQLAAAAHAWLVAGSSARAAARAAAVGAPAGDAARAALPRGWAGAARVRTAGGEVRVRVPVPAVLPGLPALGTVEGSAPLAEAGR